jgi:hypothetical protein
VKRTGESSKYTQSSNVPLAVRKGMQPFLG